MSAYWQLYWAFLDNLLPMLRSHHSSVPLEAHQQAHAQAILLYRHSYQKIVFQGLLDNLQNVQNDAPAAEAVAASASSDVDFLGTTAVTAISDNHMPMPRPPPSTPLEVSHQAHAQAMLADKQQWSEEIIVCQGSSYNLANAQDDATIAADAPFATTATDVDSSGPGTMPQVGSQVTIIEPGDFEGMQGVVVEGDFRDELFVEFSDGQRLSIWELEF